MKNIRTYVILAILCAGIAAYFIFRNNFSTVRKEDRDFAIQDTAAVTRIFLADRNNNSVTLERKSAGEWILNGSKPTRQQGVQLILDCLKKIRVQSRVPKNTFNTVVRELASTGIKMEVYLDHQDEPSKVYFIGGSTQDVMGTYMMLENSSVPFITEVPGFTGYLTPRFSPVERDWLIPEMFNLRADQIRSVSVQYLYQPEKSFTIERKASVYQVFSPVTKVQVKNVDTLKVSNYLAGFRRLNFESWDRHLSAQQRDSLLKEPPVTVLIVETADGIQTTVPMYPKPSTRASLAQADSAGNPVKYDIDRMYAFISGGKELVTVQFYVFDKIFATLEDFDADMAVRNLRQ